MTPLQEAFALIKRLFDADMEARNHEHFSELTSPIIDEMNEWMRRNYLTPEIQQIIHDLSK